MLKVENLRTFNWEGALRGLRNPLSSWAKSDSTFDKNGNIIPISEGKCKIYCNSTDGSELSTVVNIEVKYKIPSLQIDTSCNKNQFSKKDTVFINRPLRRKFGQSRT